MNTIRIYKNRVHEIHRHIFSITYNPITAYALNETYTRIGSALTALPIHTTSLSHPQAYNQSISFQTSIVVLPGTMKVKNSC